MDFEQGRFRKNERVIYKITPVRKKDFISEEITDSLFDNGDIFTNTEKKFVIGDDGQPIRFQDGQPIFEQCYKKHIVNAVSYCCRCGRALCNREISLKKGEVLCPVHSLVFTLKSFVRTLFNLLFPFLEESHGGD